MAYRIVMMEAGFICQNMALAATHHGLSAVPSGAIKESAIERYLGTPPLEAAAVFTMTLGTAKPG
jgi:nitroreductase